MLTLVWSRAKSLRSPPVIFGSTCSGAVPCGRPGDVGTSRTLLRLVAVLIRARLGGRPTKLPDELVLSGPRSRAEMCHAGDGFSAIDRLAFIEKSDASRRERFS